MWWMGLCERVRHKSLHLSVEVHLPGALPLLEDVQVLLKESTVV